MNRRSFVRSAALTIGALTIAQQKIFAAFGIDPWKITMLTDNIGVFTEKGGTILFHISGTGIVVVDAQFPDSAQHLIDELKKKSDKPFTLLINTHHHADHTAGNIAFKGLVSHVLAHENSLANQKKVAIDKKNEDAQLYPDKTFGSTWVEHLDDEEIDLYYFGAGHTNGDGMIHFKKANIVHMGDLVFNRRHPFVDRTAGASITSWITVLDKATSTFNKKTKYVCGHAGTGYDIVLTKNDVLAFKDYLSNVLKYTQEQMKAGKTKEEIVKTIAIPGSPEWQGDGIERPLGAAFDELNAAMN